MKNKYNVWVYRLICLYDYYIVGKYIAPQKELHVYSGYWDWLGKNTRHPYVYDIYKKLLIK